jgi:hypothetical protein
LPPIRTVKSRSGFHSFVHRGPIQTACGPSLSTQTSSVRSGIRRFDQARKRGRSNHSHRKMVAFASTKHQKRTDHGQSERFGAGASGPCQSVSVVTFQRRVCALTPHDGEIRAAGQTRGGTGTAGSPGQFDGCGSCDRELAAKAAPCLSSWKRVQSPWKFDGNSTASRSVHSGWIATGHKNGGTPNHAIRGAPIPIGVSVEIQSDRRPPRARMRMRPRSAARRIYSESRTLRPSSLFAATAGAPLTAVRCRRRVLS